MQHHATNEVGFTLADYQDTFINDLDMRVCAIVGAKGSSKTWSASKFVLVQIARAMEKDIREQGLMMLNSRQQVLDVYEQDVRPVLDQLNWPYHFNAQQLNLRVFNTIIHLRSADPDAVKKIESIAYDWGWADEASYYPPETLRTFVSRIRKGPALVRITSMPDEPDAYIYEFIESIVEAEKAMGNRAEMFEITLADNPDREFADRYEQFLRATYSGAQLDRFLYAKRVSLDGEGLFAVESHMRVDDMTIDRTKELVLSWDFNVEYLAVSAWQTIGHNEEAVPRVGCVASWQLKHPTVKENAEQLCMELEGFEPRIYLHGDASGDNRTAQVTDSMWKTVREIFQEFFPDVRYIVPRSNPPVKDTIQCLNWALRSNLIEFNRDERNVYMSLQAAKSDKFGEMDKSSDYKAEGGAKSHEADTARYAAFHFYQHLYPGGSGRFFVV